MPPSTAGALPRLAAALSLALLGACSLVPPYQRPGVPVASHWDNAAAPGAQVPQQWWKDYASTELDQLIQRAGSDSLSLQAAIARVDQARANARVAEAALYPDLSLGGSYVHDHDSSKNAHDLYAQASYELDFWGRNRALADSATAQAQATAYDLETVRIGLQADIADAYFQVLSLDERLAVARRIASDAGNILQLVQTQSRLGSSSDLEVEQQRNALQNFQANVSVLARQRDAALYQLAVLVGAAPEGFALQHRGLDGIQLPEARAGLPASLLGQRPDIQAAEARLLAANFDVGAARAAFLPNISLGALAGSDVRTGGGLWQLAASLGQPLFDGGLLEGQLQADRAHARELVADYRQNVLQALQDVETQLSANARLAQTQRLDQAAVDSARKAADLAQVRYRLGSTDFLTLLTVQRTLYQAEDSLLQVRLQRLQASVGLNRALGGGFQAPQAQLASNPPPAQATRP
ncbi:efflux transporter, outer membrane factor (OMF) lipoprotein, NodT family [Pseudomonas delhiensis]|uniref:Efflux transporter, outer membrane factor (OMF) lipoprotein, NodT family n=1 Tax=Pseudomonas delhiensis TaxID=366289 RepID=A0A239I739_9PSED|nr:efflux transporter outer membrane subunit [Pseudomonas delhiensis]SDJ57818.1 efflux transporter, outer membrane factor (OMF) lipoprotein, NodT family [Pseudomonas delhiensis]SNS89301.1 efflux transporter, outer membrane factor (OMF) lipoprotein, NodT family [Pseudomonas delhiensis]